MPQSPKAPPDPYTGPTNSEIMEAEVAKIKKLLGLDINRLAIGSDIEGIITGGPLGSIDYTITGSSVISFVNVTSTIGPSQTGGGGGGAGPAPAQVTGLSVSVIGDTQLNLSWTALGGLLDNYKVYSSTVNGFTPGTPTASPTSNSYSNVGLSAGTTYYYKVSGVYNGAEGPYSAQASGTTTGTPPPAGTAPPPSDLFVEPNPGAPSTQAINYFSAVTFSPAVTQYQFQYTPDATFTTGFQINYATAHPYPSGGGMSSLTPNTLYYCRVRSVNSNGNGSWSGIVTFTTAP